MISVDLDSTLLDLLTPWLEDTNKKYNTDYKVKDVYSYDFEPLQNNIDFILKENLYDDLEPIDGAVKFINYIKMFHEVQIVTHTFAEHRDSKLKFIRKYFGDIKVICTGASKLDVTEGTFLVDDCLSHIENHLDRGGKGIVYTWNDKLQYNKTDREDIIRLGSYEEIIQYLILL